MNYGGLRNDHFDTPAQINQKFLLLVLCVRHLVDEDFPASSKHLDSGRCRTVRLLSVDVDCCVPCSNAFACQREHSVPDVLLLRLWQRLPVTTPPGLYDGRVPVSDGEPMLLITETKNEISTSTDGAVCLCVLTGYQRVQVFNWVRQHVKNLGVHWNIRHHWVQLVPISCSLAHNVPLLSFAVLPILCGPV